MSSGNRSGRLERTDFAGGLAVTAAPADGVSVSEALTAYERRAEEWFSDPIRVPSYVAAHRAGSPEAHIFTTRIAKVIELLRPMSGGALVDAGCGPGMMIRALGEARPGDFETLGVDVSPPMVEEAASQLRSIEEARVVVGRAEDLPVTDDAADVGLAMGVLELADPHRVLAELARIIRPGGNAIVSMVNPSAPARVWAQRVYEPLRRRRGGAWVDEWDPAEVPWSEPDLIRALALHGLRADAVEYFVYDAVLAPFDRRLPGPRAAAMRRLERLSRTPLRRLGSYYLVRARRTS